MYLQGLDGREDALMMAIRESEASGKSDRALAMLMGASASKIDGMLQGLDLSADFGLLDEDGGGVSSKLEVSICLLLHAFYPLLRL